MRIVVLNGSPKGKSSITLQYAAYIQERFPQHEFRIVHVSQHIKQIERDHEAFQEIIDEVRRKYYANLKTFPSEMGL